MSACVAKQTLDYSLSFGKWQSGNAHDTCLSWMTVGSDPLVKGTLYKPRQ